MNDIQLMAFLFRMKEHHYREFLRIGDMINSQSISNTQRNFLFGQAAFHNGATEYLESQIKILEKKSPS